MSDSADTESIVNLTLTHEQIELIQEGLQVISDELEDKRKEVNNLRQFIGYRILVSRTQETNND
jgi:hypothetical protein